MILVDCLRQRVAVWAWKLAVCQQPTLSRFLQQVKILHARVRSYTPTSRPTACILKLAAKNGPRVHSHAYLALPRTFSGGDKYLPSLPTVTMAHLFISVAQYNQRRATLPSLFTLRHARLISTSTRCLTFLGASRSNQQQRGSTTTFNSYCPPFSLNGPASIRPVRWPESLNSCSWKAIHKEKPPSYDFDSFLIPSFCIFNLIILSIL